jgi:hypothetical protein
MKAKKAGLEESARTAGRLGRGAPEPVIIKPGRSGHARCWSHVVCFEIKTDDFGRQSLLGQRTTGMFNYAPATKRSSLTAAASQFPLSYKDLRMTDLLTRRLQQLSQPQHLALLSQGLRGVERETLRVDEQGNLARTPHPPALGSALTNDLITTDYSESLLEFITPAMPDIADALQRLDEIHRFAYTKLDGELLWNASMPCVLPPENEIPLAWYGTSHIGRSTSTAGPGAALAAPCSASPVSTTTSR